LDRTEDYLAKWSNPFPQDLKRSPVRTLLTASLNHSSRGATSVRTPHAESHGATRPDAIQSCCGDVRGNCVSVGAFRLLSCQRRRWACAPTACEQLRVAGAVSAAPGASRRCRCLLFAVSFRVMPSFWSSFVLLKNSYACIDCLMTFGKQESTMRT